MKKSIKCELGTQFCRGKGAVRLKPIGKGAPNMTYWGCLACLAILRRSGVKFKQV